MGGAHGLLIVLAVLLLLAFPVIAIVALVKAIGAGDRVDQLERRIVALEAGQSAAPAPAAPAPAAAAIEPSPIIEAAPPEPAAPEPAPSTAPIATAATPSTTLEEKFGTRWVVWVGGLALALGGIFLVRYSIEQGLIGPGMRVFSARYLRAC